MHNRILSKIQLPVHQIPRLIPEYGFCLIQPPGTIQLSATTVLPSPVSSAVQTVSGLPDIAL